jgi:hypothetical protein
MNSFTGYWGVRRQLKANGVLKRNPITTPCKSQWPKVRALMPIANPIKVLLQRISPIAGGGSCSATFLASPASISATIQNMPVKSPHIVATMILFFMLFQLLSCGREIIGQLKPWDKPFLFWNDYRLGFEKFPVSP